MVPTPGRTGTASFLDKTIRDEPSSGLAKQVDGAVSRCDRWGEAASADRGGTARSEGMGIIKTSEEPPGWITAAQLRDCVAQAGPLEGRLVSAAPSQLGVNNNEILQRQWGLLSAPICLT